MGDETVQTPPQARETDLDNQEENINIDWADKHTSQGTLFIINPSYCYNVIKEAASLFYCSSQESTESKLLECDHISPCYEVDQNNKNHQITFDDLKSSTLFSGKDQIDFFNKDLTDIIQRIQGSRA